MKMIVVFLLAAASALAQEPSPVVPTACGPKGFSFRVNLDESQHTLSAAEPGKARVYFIQDKGTPSFGIGAGVETEIALDGAWVGGNRNNSYFFMSVEPGEHHHLCANMGAASADPVELAHFTAGAGKVYFFRERIIPTPQGSYLSLETVDSDQAKYLIASYPLSVSHPKK